MKHKIALIGLLITIIGNGYNPIHVRNAVEVAEITVGKKLNGTLKVVVRKNIKDATAYTLVKSGQPHLIYVDKKDVAKFGIRRVIAHEVIHLLKPDWSENKVLQLEDNLVKIWEGK